MSRRLWLYISPHWFNSNGIPICPSLESSLWPNVACERQHKSERQSESKLEVGRQSAREPAMRSSIRMARQTTCPVTVHPPGERGHCPTPLLVCTFQRRYSRETLIKREHLEDCAADWATDTTVLWQVPVVCLRICPSLWPKIFC